MGAYQKIYWTVDTHRPYLHRYVTCYRRYYSSRICGHASMVIASMTGKSFVYGTVYYQYDSILLDVVDGHKVSLTHFLLKTRSQWNLIRRWIGWYISMMAWTMWPAIVLGILIWGYAQASGSKEVLMARLQASGDMMMLIAPIAIALLCIWVLVYMIRTALSLSFRQYFMIDKNMGIKQSLLASRDATSGHLGGLFSLGFLSAGIILLGILCVFIGLIRAIPTVMLATAFLYRKISPKA